MSNHLTYEFTSSLEYNLTRAVQHIKAAEQAHRLELEKKDEKIVQLDKKVGRLQSENNELTLEVTRQSDKDLYNNNLYKDMLTTNHLMEQITLEKSTNEQLRLELSRVRKELAAQEEKVAYLEKEHDKANHIIKTLYKKVHNQPQPPYIQRSQLSQSS